MKKRILKKLAVGLAVGMLFSTTLVYANVVSYNFTLNPTETKYSATATKENDIQYATIRQSSPNSVIEYTVLSSTNAVKTKPDSISGGNSKNFPYTVRVSHNYELKLKMYNNPQDNGGAIRNAAGNWTP